MTVVAKGGENNETTISQQQPRGQNRDEIAEEDFLLVEKLREMVKSHLTEYYDTNFNLLRWIQGHRELSLEEIAKKLRTHLKMRRSAWNLDNVARKPRKHTIHYHWKYGATGMSKIQENVVVNIEQAGHTDYAGMIKTFSIQEVLKARTQDLEDLLAECMEVEAKTGKQASVLYVMDMTGIKYDKSLIALIRGPLRALTEFMAQHYVELINAFIVVNVPTFICAIWNFAKPILPERTRQKVRILSSTNWREEILELSSPTALPAQWNLPGEDFFKAHLDFPTPYPIENYYQPMDLLSDIERVKIAAGKTHIIVQELQKNDILEWFVIGESDFGMGVFYSKNKDEKNIEEMDIAYPCLTWMPSGLSECPLNDKLVIKDDGYYKIWFTNQHSWWTTLNLRFRLNITGAAST